MSTETSGQKLWQQKVTNRSSARRSSLLLSVVFWVLFFGGLFWLCGALLTKDWWWFSVPSRPDTGEEFSQLTTTVLATVGGIIAISYLVIKYRERSAHEREQASLELQQINHDVRAAIEQLGHDKPVVRIAGVHALVDISNEHGGVFKQRIVDVLCGYLRADRADTDDKAVESTILQTIREHTQKQQLDANNKFFTDNRLWCDCTFDFHGASFSDEVNLSYSTFNRRVNFSGANFYENAWLTNTTFHGTVEFSNTAFQENVKLTAATFHDTTNFRETTFQNVADFNNTAFHDDVSFDDAKFIEMSWFKSIVFQKEARFFGTTFNANTWVNTTFHQTATFNHAAFYEHANLGKIAFRGRAQFSDAMFLQGVSFRGATFSLEAEHDADFPSDLPLTDGLPKDARWRPPPGEELTLS